MAGGSKRDTRRDRDEDRDEGEEEAGQRGPRSGHGGEGVRDDTEDSRFLYDAQRLSGYDRYGISRIEMPSDIAAALGSPSCKWIGRTVVNYGIEKEYQLPELSTDDYTWIDEAIAEIEIRFAKRQEHFDYDIYLGDFLRGNEEEIEGVIAALAAVGNGKYYVQVKTVRKQDGHDIWMYPSSFGQPGVLEESQCYDEQVENILELDKLVGHIERLGAQCVNRKGYGTVFRSCVSEVIVLRQLGISILYTCIKIGSNVWLIQKI